MMTDLGEADVKAAINHLEASNGIVFILRRNFLQFVYLSLDVIKRLSGIEAHDAGSEFEIVRSAVISFR